MYNHFIALYELTSQYFHITDRIRVGHGCWSCRDCWKTAGHPCTGPLFYTMFRRAPEFACYMLNTRQNSELCTACLPPNSQSALK